MQNIISPVAIMSTALTLLTLVACGDGKGSSPAPVRPDGAPAATSAKQPEPAATAATATTATPAAPRARPLKPEEIPPLLTQIAAGHKVIENQSFAIHLQGFQNGVFLATLSPNAKEFVFHVFQDGKRVQSLLDDEDTRTLRTAVKLSGVSFPDVDKDGADDILVLGVYSKPTGADTTNGVVYMQSKGRFSLDKARTGRINAPATPPTSLDAALKLARGQ